MKYNQLGRTDIKVSEICLGTMTWGRQNNEAEGHEQIAYALDQGINFMDTAEMYAVPPIPESYGKTEEIIGTYFKNTGNRDKWILASKVAGPGNRWVRGGGPITGDAIRQAIEGSLRRLQTDYVDLYQLHWPNRGHYHFEKSWTFDPTVQDRETVVPNMLEVLETLGELVAEGKIRHVGLSNESAWGTMQYLKLAEEHDLPRIVSIQNEYNFLRRYYDMDLAELAHHEDVGLLAYSPLAAGAISGKYLGGVLPKGTRGELAGSAYRNNELTEPAIRAYIELAKSHDLDVCQMAIAFCLTKPFMTSVIIGATNMDQLKTDIDAANLTLGDDVLDDIQSIFKRFPRTL
ncbi:MAG: aldo/keto reductase [Hyphomicrobiaceae bacterium]|nr:aldo/keto reductase [Hyphomicrobiaceae bacterium]MCC0025108.1 aldo/keto reductase [Hyphomicrobiaceae bacterium]